MTLNDPKFGIKKSLDTLMKDVFYEDLPYITYSVVFHPFLRRPQILLTFIRDLTLINSNLIKQKKKRPSLSNKVQTIPYF